MHLKMSSAKLVDVLSWAQYVNAVAIIFLQQQCARPFPVTIKQIQFCKRG